VLFSVWILGDQLLNPHPALVSAEKEAGRENITVLLVKNRALAHRFPCHAKKLVLIFSAMRHYAQELESAGFRVDYRQAQDFTSALHAHIKAYHPDKLLMMASSNLGGRAFQNSLRGKLDCPVTLLENTQFLSTRYDPLPKMKPGETVRQETFYRKIRAHYDVLMDASGEPAGGQWNFDKNNRQSLPADVHLPKILHFEPDEITRDVMDEISRNMIGVGDVCGFDLAVTREQAKLAAEDFYENRLPNFGTYEDAMRTDESVLFHSKLSPYVNIGLLDPLALVKEVEKRYHAGQVEINNAEGFIRQVIGWREYIYWQYQRLAPNLCAMNYWGFTRSLAAFFWDGKTEMNCLKTVIKRILREGYAHHIERLMLLSNFCLLTEINPHEVFDWFSALFIDAYAWVMVPNVYGMGLYADGGQVGSKPYLASANYVNKMSDYCSDCPFDHKQRVGEGACPFNFLYWSFLSKHEQKLRQNYRMARILYHLKNMDEDEKQGIVTQAQAFLANLV
jgi:deoxyribodipyrimidine photolyase-related protein